MHNSQGGKQVVILLGPPGSGKGIQATLLEEKCGFYHIETSKIIEKKLLNAKENDFLTVDNEKYFLLEEKKMREEGKLMSPPVIAFWLAEKIREMARDEDRLVMSGSPRTAYEAEKIVPLLKELYGPQNIIVISVNLSEEESIRRNSHRRNCELMRHSILHNKETLDLTICPLDGSRLIRRKDDTAQIIKTRLKEYENKTLPLLEIFARQELKINKVNGDQPVADVFTDVLKIVE